MVVLSRDAGRRNGREVQQCAVKELLEVREWYVGEESYRGMAFPAIVVEEWSWVPEKPCWLAYNRCNSISEMLDWLRATALLLTQPR